MRAYSFAKLNACGYLDDVGHHQSDDGTLNFVAFDPHGCIVKYGEHVVRSFTRYGDVTVHVWLEGNPHVAVQPLDEVFNVYVPL